MKRISKNILTFLVMLIMLLAVVPQQAHAADITSATTISNFSQTGSGQSVVINLDFAVPDSAVSGNHFLITLPDELTIDWTGGIELKAGDDVVATATPNGKVWTVTLTDYVDTHTNVRGHIAFTATLKTELPKDETKKVEVKVGSETVIITFTAPGPPPPLEMNINK